MTKAALPSAEFLPARGVICPRLGLRDDPTTAAAYVSETHACFESGKAVAIHPDVQYKFCLAGRYPRCPVYRGLEHRPPQPPRKVPPLTRRYVTAVLLFAIVFPAIFGVTIALLQNDSGDAAGPRAVRAPAGIERGQEAPDTGGPSTDSALEQMPAAAPADISDLPAGVQLRLWDVVVEWTVESGDTLFAIAALYGTTVEAIVAYNALPDAVTIFVGQTLEVPAGFTLALESVDAFTHEAEVPDPEIQTPPEAAPQILWRLLADHLTLAGPGADLVTLALWDAIELWEVLPGDSLFAIALEFGTTVEAIAIYNALDPADLLFSGGLLRVPVGFILPLSAAPEKVFLP